MSPFRRVHFDLPRWVIAALIAGPIFLGAGGAYAITQGSANNQAACDAVTGLRTDLVQTLRTIEERAITTAKEQGAPERIPAIKEGYNIMVKDIADPSCP